MDSEISKQLNELDLEKLEDLQLLAETILNLTIPERLQVHAEKMEQCNNDEDEEYSRSFYEVAKQLMDLLQSGYTLEDGIRALADAIPSVEDLPFALEWDADDDPFLVDKQTLFQYAEKTLEFNVKGPDDKMAKRILSKKASTDEWKIFALRYTCAIFHTDDDQKYLKAFLEDTKRAAMQCAELRKYSNKVTADGETFTVIKPMFNPWTDIGSWHGEWYDRGFGERFRPSAVVTAEMKSKTKVEADKDIHSGADKTGEDCLRVKDILDVEWPSLPAKKSVESDANGNNRNTQNTAANAWTERAKKKTFMNTGIAGSLDHSPPADVEDECLIDITEAYSVEDIWGYALLGQYVGRLPSFRMIKNLMNTWGVKANYKNEEGWLFFYFESAEDRDKVLIGGPYLIHERPLLLKHIPDKFAFNRRDFAAVPLWVRINGLSSRFWTRKILGNIASYIGKPLYMDPVTDGRKRHNYARVLVEINLAARIVRKVKLRFSDGEAYAAAFTVENEPKFCQSCCALGHQEHECPFLANKTAAATMKVTGKTLNGMDIATDKSKNMEQPATVITGFNSAGKHTAVNGADVQAKNKGQELHAEQGTEGSADLCPKSQNEPADDSESNAAQILETVDGAAAKEKQEHGKASASNVQYHDANNTDKEQQKKKSGRMDDNNKGNDGHLTGQQMAKCDGSSQIRLRNDQESVEQHPPAFVPPSASKVHQQHDAGPHTRGRAKDGKIT